MKKTPLLIKAAGFITLVISGAALFAMATLNHKKVVVPPHKTEQIEVAPVYDSVLLNKFTTTIRSLDFNRKTCTYAGIINLDDPNDTTNTIHNIRFLFSRVADDYYYQLGQVEIIHQGKINVYIQNDQHKVVISDQRIQIPPPVKDLDLIMKSLSSENYTLHNTVKGSKQTLAIINEQHLSCKELAVTMDTVSGKLERIYTRLNDFGSPMDKGKDRVIDVSISQISGEANRRQYPAAGAIVRMKNDKWELTEKYSNYELIRL